MSDLHVVILAAGQGTRMRSARPKVLHELAGRPLIQHVLDTVGRLHPTRTILVVGHAADQVRSALADRPGLQFVVQAPQLGTGHALLQTEDVLRGAAGTVLLVYADVPLLRTETLRRLLERHWESGAAATVLSAEMPDPYGYGRMVRDGNGELVRIVEERDASAAERAIREVNSGIYALHLQALFASLHQLAADNAQGEYYLTDLVAQYRQQGLDVETLCLESPAELQGVNSRADLAELTRILLDRTRREHMLSGVTLLDPPTAYIEPGVTIGADTVIDPGVTLTGRTSIGARCRIRSGTRVTDSIVGDDVTVLDHSIVVQSTVQNGASVGPFAHLRPGTDVGVSAQVGNFIELKKTRVGPRSKAHHVGYLGDTVIGADANIGAGTITCNFDGERKHQTTIGDRVFVGSDSQLVAPVTIGDDAYIAAGSSITEDVPPGALAVARARQTNKPDWAAARRRGPRKEE